MSNSRCADDATTIRRATLLRRASGRRALLRGPVVASARETVAQPLPCGHVRRALGMLEILQPPRFDFRDGRGRNDSA